MRQFKGAILVMLCGWALPGAAQTCSFTTTCFMTEPCEEAAWEMTLAETGDGWEMASAAGTRQLADLGSEDGHRAFVSPPENGAVALLTLSEDGAALYAELSLSGGFSVTDHGRCRPG